MDEGLARHIKVLWADPGIQQTFMRRSLYQLADNAVYFFERMDELALPTYVPTEADVMRCRARTTGIVEMPFTMDGTKLLLLDVGGQRNERKKWIFCFEGVQAVIFVASLSEYDQVLYEDNKTNRTQEALELFKETCHLKYFERTEFILFLNKRDLFAEKIKNKPLSECFEDYKGSGDYATCCQYMENKFKEQNLNPKRQIYCHFTCATDTTNVRAVFNDVKHIILTKAIQTTLV
jgi:GTPase SAR1 family protein